MDLQAHLLAQENQFWSGGEDFYRENLTDDALMAFPGPSGLMERDAAIEAIAQAPRWDDVGFKGVRLLRLNVTAATLVYEAHALRRGEDEPYSAIVSSVYVERGGIWKLNFHQQTPTVAG